MYSIVQNTQLIEVNFRQSLRGKIMMKNFSKYKSGVSHYHSGSKAQSGMIDYTFLLPCKKDLWKPQFLPEAKKICFVQATL